MCIYQNYTRPSREDYEINLHLQDLVKDLYVFH